MEDHQQLKNLRHAMKMTITEAASLCKVREDTYRKYELPPDRSTAKRVNPTVLQIMKAAFDWVVCEKPPEQFENIAKKYDKRACN